MPEYHVVALVQVLIVPFIQFPAKAPRKTAEDGLSTWAPVTPVGDRVGILGLISTRLSPSFCNKFGE